MAFAQRSARWRRKKSRVMSMFSQDPACIQYLQDIRAAACLVKETKNPKEEEDTLVVSSLPLVVKMARQYERRGVPLLDLIQEGNLSLMRAAQKFDPAVGASFLTYATWWIRQAIFRALQEGQR